eukprot:scaffold101806_cov48-Phaeocystis_antarctica.AAC.3
MTSGGRPAQQISADAGGSTHIGMHERCSTGTCMRSLQPVEQRKASQRQAHGAISTTGVVGGSAER